MPFLSPVMLGETSLGPVSGVFLFLGAGLQLIEKKSFASSISSISFAVKLVELPPYHSLG